MLLRIPGLETQLLAATTSAEFEHVWQRDGVLEALALGTTSGLLVDRAGLELAIYRRRRDVVSDDFGRQFVPACIIGGAAAAAVDWMLQLLPFKQGESWIFQLRNVGPNPVTPQIVLDVARRGDTWSPIR